MNLNSRNQSTYVPCKNCGLPVKISVKYVWMIKDAKKVTANCCSPDNPRVLGMRISALEEKEWKAYYLHCLLNNERLLLVRKNLYPYHFFNCLDQWKKK